MFWNDSKFQIDDPRTATHEDEMSLRKAWKSIVPGTLAFKRSRRQLKTNNVIKRGRRFYPSRQSQVFSLTAPNQPTSRL
jgi:hypothetical protein